MIYEPSVFIYVIKIIRLKGMNEVMPLAFLAQSLMSVLKILNLVMNVCIASDFDFHCLL
jgi:hypothetical protein